MEWVIIRNGLTGFHHCCHGSSRCQVWLKNSKE